MRNSAHAGGAHLSEGDFLGPGMTVGMPYDSADQASL